MVIEYVLGPIVVKSFEMIIDHFMKNPNARERTEVVELRSEVDFLKSKLGQHIAEDDFLRVQETLKGIYPLFDEYDINIPDINCEIEYDECVACGVCAEVCPTEAITLDDENVIEGINLDMCIGCGVCADECAVEAIKIFIPSELGNYSPSAEIKDLWVEYDSYEDDLEGMRIHVSFDINNLEGVNCQAVAYFYFETGEPLKDYNQKYCTTDGKVAATMDFEPGYANTTYDGFDIFLPYKELHVEMPGQYDLKLQVVLWYENTDLDHSRWESFVYTVD